MLFIFTDKKQLPCNFILDKSGQLALHLLTSHSHVPMSLISKVFSGPHKQHNVNYHDGSADDTGL